MAIMVTPKLANLPDVTTTTPSDGQVLTYDDGTGKWVNEAVPAGVTDHGALTGLGDDDHTQYLLKAGGTMTGALSIGINNAVTNAVTNIGTLTHNSTGTPAAGFGAGLLFQLETSTTVSQDAAQIAASWSDATHATRTGKLSFSTVTNGGALTEIVSMANAAALYVSAPTTSTVTDYTIRSERTYRHTSGSNNAHQFQATYSPVSSVTTPNFYAGAFIMQKLGMEAITSVSSALFGASFTAKNGSNADVTTYKIVGGRFSAENTSSTATPVVTIGIAGQFEISANDPITNAYGAYIFAPTGGQAVNSTALYIADHNVGSGDNYAIYTGAGKVRFGDIVNFAGTMGDSTKTVGTDAPADWVQVEIGGTTYYLPAYAA